MAKKESELAKLRGADYPSTKDYGSKPLFTVVVFEGDTKVESNHFFSVSDHAADVVRTRLEHMLETAQPGSIVISIPEADEEWKRVYDEFIATK